MQPRPPEDELARRRALREKLRRSDPPLPEEEEEPPRLTWSETFAMIVAAYQVVLPMVLISIGVLVAAYFLFTWIFH